MKTSTRLALIGAALALVSLPVRAQAPLLTFTAQTATADGSVEPVLTWSTSPAGATCEASGDWTGAKAASGTERLPSITAASTFNLLCTWAGDRSARLTWVPTTTNTNGTPYTDAAGYRIQWGTSQTALTNTVDVADPAATTYTLTDLAAGTWYFGVRSLNARGVVSDLSNLATKTVTGDTAVQRSVGITVNPVPNAPSLSVQ